MILNYTLPLISGLITILLGIYLQKLSRDGDSSGNLSALTKAGIVATIIASIVTTTIAILNYQPIQNGLNSWVGAILSIIITVTLSTIGLVYPIITVAALMMRKLRIKEFNVVVANGKVIPGQPVILEVSLSMRTCLENGFMKMRIIDPYGKEKIEYAYRQTEPPLKGNIGCYNGKLSAKWKVPEDADIGKYTMVVSLFDRNVDEFMILRKRVIEMKKKIVEFTVSAQS